MLARNLPPGAATWAALDSPAAWPTEAHVMASVFDAVQVGNWQRGNGKGDRPKPHPRPGDGRAHGKARSTVTAAKAARFVARHQEG